MSILSKSSSLVGDVFQGIYGIVFIVAVSLGAIYSMNSLYSFVAVCAVLLVITASSTLKGMIGAILPRYVPKVGYVFIAGTWVLYAMIEYGGFTFNDFIF